MIVLHLDEQQDWRGGEQQASWLIQGLAKAGHTVIVAGKPGCAFLESDHGGAPVERLALPLRAEWDLWSAGRLARIVRDRGVDILHAHTSHAHMIACLARRFARRGKVVVSRRVSFPPRRGPLNRWKYLAPDLFLSVSRKVDEVLAAYGMPAAKRAVVHSAVDIPRAEADPLPRRELGVPEDAPLLATAGALVGHKDHNNLVDAMPLVLAQFPDARLVIAGEGRLRRRLETKTAALGLRDRITLLGRREDAPRIIRAADVYVSSSWSEGLGTSILEALAGGTPVVATMAGGAAEMVLPGETGWLVPCRDPEALADGIVSSLRHREQARAMAARGRALVLERFSVERMVEETMRAYERLLH
ncbi:MAG TPA: glycosyltransferase [Candidatus Hydrogenedentes bacterium]|nr:glycosyltransferase [Candidatus Hydrogenedentota bacterium]HNT87350.1 glycosyltransferase [Candidatus Hydrogenedentota bacterium]